MVQELTAPGVTTLARARRALAAKSPAPVAAPATPQAPEIPTLAMATGDGPLDGHDRQTLVSLLVGRLKEAAVIAHGQIGGRPAVTVLAGRLAAMPWPELALLTCCITGTLEEAFRTWMAAVCREVEPRPETSTDITRQHSHIENAGAPETRHPARTDDAKGPPTKAQRSDPLEERDAANTDNIEWRGRNGAASRPTLIHSLRGTRG